jgi:hypothetical protein
MATLINGSPADQVYEYGVELCGTITPFADYEQAKEFAEAYGGNFKMRAVYLTEWFDAK